MNYKDKVCEYLDITVEEKLLSDWLWVEIYENIIENITKRNG